MVYINIFGIECGTAGDAIVLRAELVYKGGAGSKAKDVARDWKPDTKVAAAAKAGVGGSKMWKSAFKDTVHSSVKEEGGPGSPAELLRRHKAAIAVLEKHGLQGSLKTSWVAGEIEEDEEDEPAWVGVKVQADPTGLKLKKLAEELCGACDEYDEADHRPEDVSDED